MRPLFISGFGTCLYPREGLVVDDKSRHVAVEYLPRQLPFDWVIMDNCRGYASWPALRFLMAHAIPIVHMAWNGNLYGVTSPPEPLNGRVKLGQYRTYSDASAFLRTKLALSGMYIGRLAGLYLIDASAFESEVALYPESRGTDINRLLEYEAKCANVYWREYRKVARRFRLPSSSIAQRQGNKEDLEEGRRLGYG
jgi:hypothetical protein